MKRGRRIRLLPNSRQRSLFMRFAGGARFAWNESLAYIREIKRTEHRHPSQKEQREHLRELRDTTCPWLHEIPEAITKQAIKDLDKAYKRAYDNHRTNRVVSRKRDKKTGRLRNPYGFPEFHSRHAGHLSFYQRTDAFRVVDANHVKITGVRTPVKVKYRHVPDKIGNPRITFDGVFWYLSWAEDRQVIQQGDDGRIVGIDVGMKHLAVTSDGEYFDIPENMNPNIQRLRKRKKYLQRRLSRKYEAGKDENGRWRRDAHGRVIKSNNVCKLEHKVRKLDRAIANASRECRQRAVNDIVSSKPKTVVIEDLNVKGMFANRHLRRKLQRVGVGEFLSMLAWNCEAHGIEIVRADRFYPSTQRCSGCGSMTGPRGFEGLRMRSWSCSVCGMSHDRDFNASVNLRDYVDSGYVCRSIKARGALRQTRVPMGKAKVVNRVAKVTSVSFDAG